MSKVEVDVCKDGIRESFKKLVAEYIEVRVADRYWYTWVDGKDFIDRKDFLSGFNLPILKYHNFVNYRLWAQEECHGEIRSEAGDGGGNFDSEMGYAYREMRNAISDYYIANAYRIAQLKWGISK